jgi:hypothetical protein
MESRTHMSSVVRLLMVAVCLATASLVSAQNYFGPPPLPPGPVPGPVVPGPVPPAVAWGSQVPLAGEPSLWYGMFYLTSGVKWRYLSTVFDPHPQPHPDLFSSSTAPVVTLPTFPFGPSTEGPFATFAAGDNWVYSNGDINSADPAVGPLDQAWPGAPPPANNALGHDSVLSGGVLTPRNTGSFSITDPLTQTSNAGGTISSTTSVTFNLVATNNGSSTSSSSVVSANPRESSETKVDSVVWAPYLEAGFHQSSFFDLFLGFSGFDISKVYRETVLYDVTLTTTTTTQIITGALDTFPFSSTNSTDAWTIFTAPFDSALSTLTDTNQYYVYPVGVGTNLPTRTFTGTSTTAAHVVQLGTLADNLFSRIDVSMYELKPGARSWFPLYGLGRTTASLGSLFTWLPHQIVTTSRVTTLSDIVDPATGTIIVPADTILQRTVSQQSSVWFNFGAFVSLGLEVGFPRWFFTSSIEYDLYFLSMHFDDVVDTRFDPSGVSGDIGVGIRF